MTLLRNATFQIFYEDNSWGNWENVCVMKCTNEEDVLYITYNENSSLGSKIPPVSEERQSTD